MTLTKCTFHTQENIRVKCLVPVLWALGFLLGAGPVGQPSNSQGLSFSSSGGGHDVNLYFDVTARFKHKHSLLQKRILSYGS